MRRLPALFAALLLPAAQLLLLSTALSTASLLVSEAPAQAQSQEVVGRVAQAITVSIEGAAQGLKDGQEGAVSDLMPLSSRR